MPYNAKTRREHIRKRKMEKIYKSMEGGDSDTDYDEEEETARQSEVRAKARKTDLLRQEARQHREAVAGQDEDGQVHWLDDEITPAQVNVEEESGSNAADVDVVDVPQHSVPLIRNIDQPILPPLLQDVPLDDIDLNVSPQPSCPASEYEDEADDSIRIPTSDEEPGGPAQEAEEANAAANEEAVGEDLAAIRLPDEEEQEMNEEAASNLLPEDQAAPPLLQQGDEQVAADHDQHVPQEQVPPALDQPDDDGGSEDSDEEDIDDLSLPVGKRMNLFGLQLIQIANSHDVSDTAANAIVAHFHKYAKLQTEFIEVKGRNPPNYESIKKRYKRKLPPRSISVAHKDLATGQVIVAQNLSAYPKDYIDRTKYKRLWHQNSVKVTNYYY